MHSSPTSESQFSDKFKTFDTIQRFYFVLGSFCVFFLFLFVLLTEKAFVLLWVENYFV